jgi:glycosyltransferase involved in cell wall biosynthesis
LRDRAWAAGKLAVAVDCVSGAIPIKPVSMNTHSASRVSIVIPVYAGERTLPALLAEIAPLTQVRATPAGSSFIVCEVLLVHDCGPNRSDQTIEDLSTKYPFVKPVWLSRNFGQHAATLAGMASATGDWVVTIDEDQQQDPADIGAMLDLALVSSLQLVYAQPSNAPPHGWLRNMLSGTAKAISTRVLGNDAIGRFNSFRLVEGEIARTLAAYCGNGVYLDVGLFWIAARAGHCPVMLRSEGDRPSGYSYLKLMGHFWRLVLTTGTRPLRLITIMGFSSMILAALVAIYALYAKFYGQVPVQGWTSLLIVVAFFSGSILASLGVIAEYLAVTMGIVMGKPLYVVSTRPTRPAVRR